MVIFLCWVVSVLHPVHIFFISKQAFLVGQSDGFFSSLEAYWQRCSQIPTKGVTVVPHFTFCVHTGRILLPVVCQKLIWSSFLLLGDSSLLRAEKICLSIVGTLPFTESGWDRVSTLAVSVAEQFYDN